MALKRSKQDYTRPTRREYVIMVATQTVWQSFTSDVLTVVVIAVPIVINEMTIKMPLLNFIFGIMLFGMMILKLYRESKSHMVRGRIREELVENLLTRIDHLERGNQ